MTTATSNPTNDKKTVTKNGLSVAAEALLKRCEYEAIKHESLTSEEDKNAYVELRRSGKIARLTSNGKTKFIDVRAWRQNPNTLV